MDIVIFEDRDAERLLHFLQNIIDSDPHRIRFAIEGGGIKVKVNEECWSPPLGRMADEGGN